jgi:S1-C subfamily serine protease
MQRPLWHPSFSRLALALLVACGCCGVTSAQLSDEMRDMMSELIGELDEDLRERFQASLDKDSSKVVLTPDQFRRFRDHPMNPFDGMDGVDPDTLKGNIELNFQIPGLRDRRPLPLERQHNTLLATLAPLSATINRSVVDIHAGNRMVGLGTVVAPGRVVCKASELLQEDQLSVSQSGSALLPARVIRRDSANDLAVLSFDASAGTDSQAYVPIQWSTRQPAPGEFVVTAGGNGQPAALGTYSNPPRAQRSIGQGFLGVQPENCDQGLLLVEVNRGGAGEIAGLKAGDILTTVDGKPMSDVAQLVAEIGRRHEGDEIEIRVIRDGAERRFKAVLAGREVSAERASKFRMMNRLGAVPSKRTDGFAWVFQHDTPLFPEQCGGPILDLNGNVLGINIAREGRVSSLAIPSAHLQTILPELLREDVAGREPETAGK